MIKKNIDTEAENSEFDYIREQTVHYIDGLDDIYTEPLGRKREYNLAKQIRDLEKERRIQHPAGKELVERNLRLVKSIANEYYKKTPNHIDYSDILQEGIFGLLVAVINYKCDFIKDEHKKEGRTEGYRFSTYATNWIRNSISRFYRNEDKNSLNKDVAEGIELIKIIENKNVKKVDENIEENEIKELICKSIENLPNREKKIIKLRYGIEHSSIYTLEEVAEQIGVTRERVRQLEKISLKKLRNMSKMQELTKV